MALVHYKTGNPLSRLDNEINRIFFNAHATDAANQEHDWAPAMDIREEENRYILEADIPGVPRKDVDITLENDVLTIKGQRTLNSEINSETYRRKERAHGSFVRQFNLPDTVNADAISAAIDNGVLEISIPKQAKPEARKITVE